MLVRGFLSAFFLVIVLTFSSSQSSAVILKDNSSSKIASQIAKLNVPFISNAGQADAKVSFYARTYNGTVFVTEDGEIVYSLMKIVDESTATRLALKEEFVGGTVNDPNGEEESVTRVNYFMGNDSSKWRSEIPSYELVSLGEVYSGIGVKLKAYGDNVEKIFYVEPGANPKNMQMKLSGANSMKINKFGELEISTDFGKVKFTKPAAYQIRKGKTVKVSVKYKILNKSELMYGFKLGKYDKTKELVIDPLLASTFLGGNRSDLPWSIAVDSSGDIYIAGYTESIDFPSTTGVFDILYSDFIDVFVSKLSGDLTKLLASTFLGGFGADYAWALAIDSSGNVYVTGSSYAFDFPTTTLAYQTSRSGNADVFVSELNGDLTELLASTFLGGTDYEQSYAIALDSAGDVYVAGLTYSSDFPTTDGAYDVSFNVNIIDGITYGVYPDAFISKLSGDLKTLVASTFLGGKGTDYVLSIALNNSSGNVYVTGNTYSSDFPTTAGAYDTSFNVYTNGGVYADAFVSELSGDLKTLIASTFLGGKNEEYSDSIALDSSGNVCIAGYTYSSDFPTTSSAYDTSFNNGAYAEAFVSKLSGDLTTLLASTFLGGSQGDYAGSIAIDSIGSVYVTGNTYSSNFPTTPGAFDTSFNGNADVFVSKLNGDLTILLASTFLGGSSYEDGWAIAIDTLGNIYVSGNTYSSDFPITSGAYDTSFNGDVDIFISKFDANLFHN